MYRDQLEALALLRSIVPDEVAIVVKKYPSIHNHRMLGHLGRHPRHYKALTRIAGSAYCQTRLLKTNGCPVMSRWQQSPGLQR
jgi:hypothetical protein